jgi:hypothetical protein
LSFFVYNPEKNIFTKLNSRDLAFQQARIINVFANDINGDSNMDLIVEVNYTQFKDGNKIEYVKGVEVYLSNSITGGLTKAYTLPVGQGGILVADLNGDRL